MCVGRKEGERRGAGGESGAQEGNPAGSRGRGLARMHSRFVGFCWRTPCCPGLFGNVQGRLVASWAPQTIPSEVEGRHVHQANVGFGRPTGWSCCTPLAQDLLWADQDKTVVRVAHVTVPGQAWRHSSDFTRTAGPVNLVDSDPQVHGQRHRRRWCAF